MGMVHPARREGVRWGLCTKQGERVLGVDCSSGKVRRCWVGMVHPAR